MRNNGFVLAVSVFLIVFFALLFSLAFVKHSQGIEGIFQQGFALEKAGFVSDNVFSQAALLLGTGVKVESNASSTVVSLSDSLPSGISQQRLSGFKSFVEGKFAALNNAQISLDLSGISDGKAELLFSNGLRHDLDYSSGSEVIEVFSDSVQGQFSRIDLNINSNASMIDFNAWQWQPSGDLEVKLNYKDSAVTIKAEGKIDSSVLNSYSFNYSNGTLHVEAGNINGRKALRAWQDSMPEARAKITASVFLPLQESLNYYYNADLNYSQLNAKYNAKLRPLNGLRN
jgi:hypothetical protein